MSGIRQWAVNSKQATAKFKLGHHRAATVHSHFLEGWYDMRDLGAVLDQEEPLPPSSARCSSVAGSSARRVMRRRGDPAKYFEISVSC
jgi:hypothetical protein